MCRNRVTNSMMLLILHAFMILQETKERECLWQSKSWFLGSYSSIEWWFLSVDFGEISENSCIWFWYPSMILNNRCQKIKCSIIIPKMSIGWSSSFMEDRPEGQWQLTSWPSEWGRIEGNVLRLASRTYLAENPRTLPRMPCYLFALR